jgi:hypothetical protein
MPLGREELRQLALAGAKTRLQELEEERRSLLQTFPELGSGRRAGAASQQASKPGRRRRNLSPAQRRAISKRMKTLWAERRKAKGKAA